MRTRRRRPARARQARSSLTSSACHARWNPRLHACTKHVGARMHVGASMLVHACMLVDAWCTLGARICSDGRVFDVPQSNPQASKLRRKLQHLDPLCTTPYPAIYHPPGVGAAAQAAGVSSTRSSPAWRRLALTLIPTLTLTLTPTLTKPSEFRVQSLFGRMVALVRISLF